MVCNDIVVVSIGYDGDDVVVGVFVVVVVGVVVGVGVGVVVGVVVFVGVSVVVGVGVVLVLGLLVCVCVIVRFEVKRNVRDVMSWMCMVCNDIVVVSIGVWFR